MSSVTGTYTQICCTSWRPTAPLLSCLLKLTVPLKQAISAFSRR